MKRPTRAELEAELAGGPNSYPGHNSGADLECPICSGSCLCCVHTAPEIRAWLAEHSAPDPWFADERTATGPTLDGKPIGVTVEHFRCKTRKPDGSLVDGCGWQGQLPWMPSGRQACPACGSPCLRLVTPLPPFAVTGDIRLQDAIEPASAEDLAARPGFMPITLEYLQAQPADFHTTSKARGRVCPICHQHARYCGHTHTEMVVWFHRLQHALDNPPGPRHARLVDAKPTPTDATGLPTRHGAAHLPGLGDDPAARKAAPMARGLLDYFPNALATVAHVSKVGNDQHNPGEPMHWAFEKSSDEADCILRHLAQRGTIDTDGLHHSAKVAWRALALLERELLAANPALKPGLSVKGR